VKNGNLLAVGVNCINPEHVAPLFKNLNEDLGESQRIPLVVYPNSGEQYSVELGWYGKETCVPIEDYVPEWINLGAKFVGGCCRTSAKDIQKIKMKIDSFKKN
jgi:S-methylmethionine-dependent homocysteine/selenocysteine methylase